MMQLEIKNLSYRIGKKKILDRVDLSIEKQSIFGLLGPNGAGKSTLIKLMLGLVFPTEGTILFEEKKMNRYSRTDILKKTGSLIEHASLYPHLTAYENLELARRIYQTDKNRSLELLDTVGLKEEAGQKVKRFSLGMKQRLGIALALIGNPSFVVLDEPLNGLDPQGIVEFRNLVLRMNRESGITFLISSHTLPEIEKTATHIGFINKGSVLEQGPINAFPLQDTGLEDYYLNLVNTQKNDVAESV